MARKKKGQSQGPDLSRPWCYHCDRDFDDVKVLIAHQKAKHYKCPQCPRKLNTPIGFAVHIKQVHKKVVTTVENAIPGRDCCHIEIFGMDGIPESEIVAHEARMWESWNKTHGITESEFLAKRQKIDQTVQPHGQPFTFHSQTPFSRLSPPINQTSPPLMEPVTKGVVKFPPRSTPGTTPPIYRPPVIPAPPPQTNITQYPTHNLPIVQPVSNQPFIGPQPPPPAPPPPPSTFYLKTPGVTKGVVKFPPPGARPGLLRFGNNQLRDRRQGPAQSLKHSKERSQARNSHWTSQKQRRGSQQTYQGLQSHEGQVSLSSEQPCFTSDVNLAHAFGLPPEYAAFYKSPPQTPSLQNPETHLPSPPSATLQYPLVELPKTTPLDDTGSTDSKLDESKLVKLNTEPIDMHVSTNLASDVSGAPPSSKNQPKRLVYLDPNLSPACLFKQSD